MKISMKITSLAHYIGGLLAALTGKFYPVLAVIATVLFIIYELDEDWHLNDKAFRDIREYLIGFFVGLILLGVEVWF